MSGAGQGGGEWYERWFGEAYLSAYPHRDHGEAEDAVDLVLRHARRTLDEPVIDVACGAGRHLLRLRERGRSACGVDLSLPLLRRAREQGLRVVRADMRVLPFATDSAGTVTNFFTSFGYFPDPEEDERVLAEVQRVLRPGGTFAFDFLNAEHVRRTLRPGDQHVTDEGLRIVQHRRLADGGEMVEKRIEIHDPAGRLPHVYYERVRLYTPERLEELLDAHDLITHFRFGDYAGAPLGPDSPRAIFIGRLR